MSSKTKPSTKAKPKRIKVSLPVFLRASDGDIAVYVCKSEEDAEKFAEQNLRDGNSSLCGEVQWIEVVVDEKGKLLSGYDEPDSDDSEDESSD